MGITSTCSALLAAQNADHPEPPVCLDIYAGGRLIAQVLANRYREDLDRAGIGSGHHSFEFMAPAGLAFAPGALEVRRSLDGGALEFSAEGRRSLQRLEVATNNLVARAPQPQALAS